MEWKSIKDDGYPTALCVLFTKRISISLNDSGWGYRLGIYNNAIKRYFDEDETELVLGEQNYGCTHYLVLVPPWSFEPKPVIDTATES